MKEEGFPIEKDDVLAVMKHCKRKMIAAGITNRLEYMPYLFEDEIRNFCIRKLINDCVGI